MTVKTLVHRGMVYVIEGDIYIKAETVPMIAAENERITEDTVVHEDPQRISQTEVDNKINNVSSTVLPAILQPPGERDPESDLPCSCPRRRFADPPDQLPMPATYQHWRDG